MSDSKETSNELTVEQAHQAWNNGFHSASTLCQDLVEKILEKAQYSVDVKGYFIPKEVFDMQLSRVQDGLYTGMRIGQQAGLEYYLNNTWDANDRRDLEDFGVKR